MQKIGTKISVLFILFLITANLRGQEKYVYHDENKYDFIAETGMALMYLPDRKTAYNWYEYPGLFLRATYVDTNSILVSLSFKRNQSGDMGMNFPDTGVIRYYVQDALDVAVGKQFSLGNFRFQTFAIISVRSGMEDIGFGEDFREYCYYINTGLGAGVGGSAQYIFLRHLVVGIEVHYNYYFGRTRILSASWDPAWDDYKASYRISHQRITPIFKLGYSLKF